MKQSPWSKFGGVLGILYCVAGFVLIFLGWNGAASNDTVEAQMPYVVSGGIAGLALVVVGAGLMVAHSLRTDRVELRGAIEDLRQTIEREGYGPAPAAASGPAASAAVAGGDDVVVGADSYHRADCAVVVGQAGAAVMSRGDAGAAGLQPCRVCRPDVAAA